MREGILAPADIRPGMISQRACRLVDCIDNTRFLTGYSEKGRTRYMAKTGSKSYDPASTEKRIWTFWEKGGYFHPTPDERPRDKRYCIMIPLPNVTAALHLGHALNNTLQDILTRLKRMQGCNTLWMMGTDHAGIATQATVEKAIFEQEGKNRHDLGRDELVRRIWDWKHKFGGRIIEQLKLMGCSGDYERERFTLDEGCAKAVRHTFFKLFRDGLIYRGKRLVNWDTQLHTAVADDEVYHETIKGYFWHFKYPVIDPQPGEPQFVHIATTRPETMLGDTAVAVHPKPDVALARVEAALKEKLASVSEKERPEVQAALDDLTERRKTLLPTLLKLRDMADDGRMVTLPLVDRPIPLICDEWAKPELGGGCVKITPAHDPNDYDVGKRHDLAMVNVMTEDGKIARIVEPDGSVNPNSEKYEGLRFATKGREKVVADLEALGLVERIEGHVVDIGHSDRSKTPVEPFLSDQWFVKMGDLEPEHAAKIEGLRHGASGLCQMAMDAVKAGKVRFFPPRYEKTYMDWLAEKRDWCISRQLWWGHRIPVWTKRLHLTENNWIDELTPKGIDSLLEGNWGGADRLVVRVINADTGEVLPNPLHEFFPVVPDSEGEYMFHVCLRDDDPETVKLLLDAGFEQDPDVLDTWFSSALWPHSTLGWPDAQASIRAPTVREGSAISARAVSFDRQPLPHGRGSDQDRESDPGCGSDQNTGEAPVPHNVPVPHGSPAPIESNLLDYWYPTNVLITAREIITLWVARMVMTGLYNVNDIPFSDVIIHTVIQDGQGRKMSKMLGNGVDPQDIIEEYGADALRFTLADQATETQDIRLPVKPKKLPDGRTINISERFEKGRNFCNKLWQASTGFVIPNLDGFAPGPLDPAKLRLEDRWILSRMTACIEKLNQTFDGYQWSVACETVYGFMWDEYCSWYIEMVKSRLTGARDGTDRDEPQPRADDPQPRSEDRGSAQQVLVFVIDQLLRMLHPLIPFVTEAIWAELNAAAPRRGLRAIEPAEPALIMAKWPTVDEALRDESIESQMGTLQALIRGVRDIRAAVNGHRGRSKQPSMRTLPAVTVLADAETCRLVETYRAFVMPLAGCDSLEAGPALSKPSRAMSYVEGPLQVYVPVGDLVDLAEVKRSEEAKLAELRAAIVRAEKQLANENFVNRADPAVVSQAKQRAVDVSSQIRLIEQHLADMA